ncbi:hypothetical protein PG994_014623 [Apiospora phragmitis]|uniref:Amino acid permease/ SLC12A domain-containing protein n=1 Tax=Apiospora phragmitis TaxID=2905665 RepID=A0ABR1T6I3_9PEZI
MQVQGVSRDTLPWEAPFQPYAAWIGFIGSSAIVLITGFPVFLKGNFTASGFIAAYVGIPIFVIPIIIWKLVYKTKVSPGRLSSSDPFEFVSALTKFPSLSERATWIFGLVAFRRVLSKLVLSNHAEDY